MAHEHEVTVVGAVFEVDPITRKVSSGELKKISSGDHNSTRWGFSMPRFINGHDMSLCQEVTIHTTNISEDKRTKVEDIYNVDDFAIDENDDSKMKWTWLVKRGATKYAGTTEFGLCFRCLTDEAIDYDFNTEECTKEIIVLKGKHNEEAVDDIFLSFIEQVREASGAVAVDKTLTQSGKAADAKITGEKIGELQATVNDLLENGTGTTVTGGSVKTILANIMTIMKAQVQINADGTTTPQAYSPDISAIASQTDTLIANLGTTDEPDEPIEPDNPEVTLSSISATYTGGNVLVGTSVNLLTGITVKAHYSDGSTSNVTDYTLSGTIAEGSNTITVSYGGKTTTFTVTGVAESGGEDEPTDDGTEWVDGVPYEYTLVANEYAGSATVKEPNGIKTYNGWSRTPFLPCKGVSSINVVYINDTGSLKLIGAYGAWYDADKKFIKEFNQSEANLSSVQSDACFVILSQSDAIMNNIASITPHA